MVVGVRLSIISEVNAQMEAAGVSSIQTDGADSSIIPSSEAMSKIEDYREFLLGLCGFEHITSFQLYNVPPHIAIPYTKEEQAQAATKDPYLKLVLRLIDAHTEDAGEFG